MRKLSFGKAINEALDQEMGRDDKVFVIGEDVAQMGGDLASLKDYGKSTVRKE